MRCARSSGCTNLPDDQVTTLRVSGRVIAPGRSSPGAWGPSLGRSRLAGCFNVFAPLPPGLVMPAEACRL